MDIWQLCDGERQVRPLRGKLLRMVESQAQVATLHLVDTLAEQALLEELLEASKPPLLPALAIALITSRSNSFCWNTASLVTFKYVNEAYSHFVPVHSFDCARVTSAPANRPTANSSAAMRSVFLFMGIPF